MRKIHFKSGATKEVSQIIVDLIYKNITDGCLNWQCFEIDDVKSLIINLDNIDYID